MTRLSPERLDELYRGTLALVAEHGFERLTMDQVAEATRSSKATLYRQWGSKAGLVAAAIKALARLPETPPDTESLRGDLRSMVERRDWLLEPQGDLIGALLASVRSDPDLHVALRAEVVTGLGERLDTVVGRAVDRGEVTADQPGRDHLTLLVISPFVLRVLLDGGPPDDAYLHDYVDRVLLPVLGVPAPTEP